LIQGRRTEFLSPSPAEMGMREFEKIYAVVPVIPDRKFKVGKSDDISVISMKG
jgi:hypothetical protein